MGTTTELLHSSILQRAHVSNVSGVNWYPTSASGDNQRIDKQASCWQLLDRRRW